MHRTVRSYELLEPPTLEEAVKLLNRYGNKAKVLAGGLDIVSKMRRWQINPQYLVSIRDLPGLCHIERTSNGDLEIGAMARLHDVEIALEVKKEWPVLYEAVHQIASVQVKTMGTLVGNLCVATPASDIAPVLFILGARLQVVGPSGEKTIPIEQFFIPVCQHILKPDEIVTKVLVPHQPRGVTCAFKKLAHTAACIAKINTAVSLTMAKNSCKNARIALGSVAPCVIRATQAETTLTGSTLVDAIITRAANKAAEEATPISDLRSTAEYRKHMVAVLVKRAIKQAMTNTMA